MTSTRIQEVRVRKEVAIKCVVAGGLWPYAFCTDSRYAGECVTHKGQGAQVSLPNLAQYPQAWDGQGGVRLLL